MGDLSLIPGLVRSPGEGKGYPPQFSGLENSMNCIVKSWTWLSDFHFLWHSLSFTFTFYCYWACDFIVFSPQDLVMPGITCLFAFWNENIPWHINKQERSQPPAISGLRMWMRAPKTAIQWMLPPPQWCWGAGEMQEARGTSKQDWPQIAEEPMQGMDSVSPEACIFPHTECWIP